ncbi:hypothetical protein HPB48_023315 [Haemaphysalis longicornis]|uniref:Uncharacterized protein n=1 Tax=Haemaphysalis longicornis TaxID=44386 RepID=A0A9J6H5Z5_HAELO|nr:hypothetical protein HPB48_023315 [Haemaphysalis longicornis]
MVCVETKEVRLFKVERAGRRHARRENYAEHRSGYYHSTVTSGQHTTASQPRGRRRQQHELHLENGKSTNNFVDPNTMHPHPEHRELLAKASGVS